MNALLRKEIPTRKGTYFMALLGEVCGDAGSHLEHTMQSNIAL